jgi:hypothetical protein
LVFHITAPLAIDLQYPTKILGLQRGAGERVIVQCGEKGTEHFIKNAWQNGSNRDAELIICREAFGEHVRDRLLYLYVTARPSFCATDSVVKDQTPDGGKRECLGTLPVVSATVNFFIGMPASLVRKTMASGML